MWAWPGLAWSKVLEYNPGDRSWKQLPSLLTARSRCAVTVLGGDVVVMGGTGLSGEYLASAERYNRRSQRWEAMPSLTNASEHCKAAAVVPV